MEDEKKDKKRLSENVDMHNLLAAGGAALLVVVLTALGMDFRSAWFTALVKPAFYPSNLLFSIVWTMIYFLWGYSFYRVLGVKGAGKEKTYWIYAINGVLNIAWTWAFYKFHWLGAAVFIIAAMILSTGSLIRFTVRRDKVSGYMNVPYLLWSAFALVLNYAIAMLN